MSESVDVKNLQEAGQRENLMEHIVHTDSLDASAAVIHFLHVAACVSTVYSYDSILVLSANSISCYVVNSKEKSQMIFLQAPLSVASPRSLWYDIINMDAVFPLFPAVLCASLTDFKLHVKEG